MMYKCCLVLQVSSIMGLSMRWQTCVQVRSQRNQMPPCLWKGSSSMWPGTPKTACHVNVRDYVLLKYDLVYITFLCLSTEAGRETSGGMWRTEKMYPAGSFTVMEQASLMEIQENTLCRAFLNQFKSSLHTPVSRYTINTSVLCIQRKTGLTHSNIWTISQLADTIQSERCLCGNKRTWFSKTDCRWT